MELRDSITKENLLRAFAGESQEIGRASCRERVWASV